MDTLGAGERRHSNKNSPAFYEGNTMITFVRSAVALPGKMFEVLAFAKEMAAVVKRANGTDLSVGSSVGGVVGEIVWISTYDSLAQMEERVAKMTADPGYVAALKKAEGLLVPGATRDHIWRHG